MDAKFERWLELLKDVEMQIDWSDWYIAPSEAKEKLNLVIKELENERQQ